MKILFFLGLPNPSPGASWTRIGFFAKKLSEKGRIVEVLGSFSFRYFSDKGVRKHGNFNIFNLIFSIGLDHPLSFILNGIISFVVSTLFLVSRKPHLTVVSVPPGDVGFGSLVACRLIRVRYVVDYRDEWEDYAISISNSKIKKKFYNLIKKLSVNLYLKSQVVTVVTPNIICSLRSRGVSNLMLIPNGADVRTFSPLTTKKTNEVFKIIHAGGVGGFYRLDIAVRAIKKLIEIGIKNIKLIIVGVGEIEKILNIAHELNIEEAVEYRGVIIDKRKLAELIREADVGLIPYDDNPLWKNALPAKFFEYCACGIPVITTAYNDSLLAKLIREYKIGLVVPPMDDKKLAEAIYKMYDDQGFRKLAGKRARSLVEEQFDRNKIAEQFIFFLENML
jgi:glycosyltransferase involved in cell wall biosynthesis